MSEHLHMCEGCRERTAARRCTGCQKVWYCNKECQATDWYRHIFKCNPRRPINTADHLALAVYRDLLPTDPQTVQEWGIDKAGLYDPSGPNMIFGLYVGLIKYCNVKPQQLHKWRVQGRLIPEIKAIYEAIPKHARGGYYDWFLEHQSVLEEPEISQSEADSQFEDMERRAWVAMGNPPDTPPSVIRTSIESFSKDRQMCFKFYALQLSSSYPSPETVLYLPFGFCTCPTVFEEMQLSGLYTALLRVCTFDEFCEAYSTGKLLDLMDSKNIRVDRLGVRRDLLADVFDGGPRVNNSVWDLKQFVAANGEGRLVPSATVDYGFMNCAKNNEHSKQLFSLYKNFFESDGADPRKLHAACIEGRLFRFFTEDLRMPLPGGRKLFKRLLKNPYPLADV